MPTNDGKRAPNILLIVNDQERYFDKLPPKYHLPGKQRLLDLGTEFTNQQISSCVCTSSRSNIYTGQHIQQTKMFDNLNFPWVDNLSTDIPTIGHMMRELGYYSAYQGKFHLNRELEHHQDPPQLIGRELMTDYGFSDYTGVGDSIGMTLGECRLIPGHTVGRLTAPDGTPISWELTYDPHRLPLYLFPLDAMYTGPLPKNKTLTPTSDSRFRGFFEAGDRCLDLADWPGMQGHNWGQSHAVRYGWAHCNVFDDCEGTVFEGISAQIKLGPVTTPLLSAGLLIHQGVTYKFNALHNWLRAAPMLTYTSWQFTLRETSVDGQTLRNPVDVTEEPGQSFALKRDLVVNPPFTKDDFRP